MRTWIAAMLMIPIAGCATAPVVDSVLCSGTVEARAAHAAALVADGGPQSRATGRTLIARIDAGCGV